MTNHIARIIVSKNRQEEIVVVTEVVVPAENIEEAPVENTEVTLVDVVDPDEEEEIALVNTVDRVEILEVMQDEDLVVDHQADQVDRATRQMNQPFQSWVLEKKSRIRNVFITFHCKLMHFKCSASATFASANLKDSHLTCQYYLN